MQVRLYTSLVLAQCACAAFADGEQPVPEPQAGWVISSDSEAPDVVLPAVEAVAWRYDGDEGKPMTDVWIAAAPLTAEQNPCRRSKSSPSSGSTAPGGWS